MKIIQKKLSEIRPYPNNPRRNEPAVDAVCASLREFGWKQPIVIDKDGEIIAGHTRFLAAKRLNFDTVPVVVADDLTEEQVKAYRLADNKTAEFADWDFDKLDLELLDISEIDMEQFGFDTEAVAAGAEFFDDRPDEYDDRRQEGNDEYNEFLDKFEAKRTTDDCFTPKLVYEAVANWVSEKYGIAREKFIRPFFPGGDYQNHEYPKGGVVVDNPPFSILSEIVQWYGEHDVKFFLFAPALTLFSSSSSSHSCALGIGVGITYENKANVSTSFLTNLEEDQLRARSDPSLYKAVKDANDQWLKGQHKELPHYSYPDEVLTSTMLAKYSKYGVEFAITKCESEPWSALDAQKEAGKAIFGKGYLISKRAAAERAAAERAAAERAAAERAAAERWELSEREKEIVSKLSNVNK